MRKVKLKELCIPDQVGKYGIPASAEPFSQNKMRYLRITDIDDFGNILDSDKKSVSAPNLDKYLLQEGDIVFARTGNSTGRTYYHENKNGKLAFAGFLIKYGLDEKKVNPKYLKYFTISQEYKQWVKNLSVGSTRGNINAQTFADCPISLPERNQQDKLVKILSALDDKIELNNRINAELEEVAKLLYDYWFVQFDFPNAEGKPYKASGGAMVYNETLKRDIPEGWEGGTVSRMAQLIRGVSYTKEDQQEKLDENSIAILRATNITGNKIDLLNPVIVPSRLVDEKQILNKYDILLTMSSGSIDHIGKNGFYYFNEKVAFGAFCAKLVAAPLHRYFLYQFMQSASLSTMIKNECLGTNINNLNAGMVGGFKTVLPEVKILERFNEIVAPLFSKIEINTQQAAALASLRDWLLPMLMNGQAVVVSKAAEAPLSMAAEESVAYGPGPASGRLFP